MILKIRTLYQKITKKKYKYLSERPRSSLQLIFANFAMDSIQDGGAPAFLAPGEVGSKSGGKLGGPAHLLGQGVV